MESLLIVVTLGSLLLAAGLSVVGWRLLSAERDQPVPADLLEVSEAEPISPWRRRLAVAGAAALVLIAATSFVMARRGPTADTAPAPLALLSLAHSVDAPGTFAVTGSVETPADGSPLDGVVAVVYLFDRHDRYVGVGKAPLDPTGSAETPLSLFAVRVRTTAEIGRYRIAFQNQAGAPWAHVDHRPGAEPATAAPVRGAAAPPDISSKPARPSVKPPVKSRASAVPVRVNPPSYARPVRNARN